VTIRLEPLNPPIIIPANGGSFAFDVVSNNADSSAQTFDVWCKVEVPGGSQFTAQGPDFGLTLPPLVNLTRLRSQAVPPGAPAGSYIYWGFVGTYPWTVIDSDNFSFFKEGF